MSNSGGPGRREVAYRLFAAEFEDAEFSYSESDEERAPNYVVTPTGARVNRLFAVGVLTEVESVNPEMVRGRVVDPTGAFVTYAGQYQPEALAFLERAEPPTFLALSGKARTFEPEDGDRVFTSVRPESVSEVDAETRDRWVVTAVERTLERIGIMASAIESGLEGDQLRAALEEAGVDERLADGVTLALDYYGTTPAYLDALRNTALDAARVVAGEADEVEKLDLAPGEGSAGPEGPRGEGGEAAGAGDASALASLDLQEVPSPEAAETAEPAESTETAETGTSTATETDVESDGETAAEPTAEETATETGTEPEPETTTEPESTDELEPETATEAAADPEPTTEPDTGEEASVTDSVEGSGQEPADSEDAEAVEEELEDFDPGEFELDEEERREVEEEYGTEFSTAGEVEEAGIETPEPDAETASDRDVESTGESGSTPEAEPEPESEPELESDPGVESPEADDAGAEAEDTAAEAEEVDLEDAVMETMEELDDGDGADHDELVSSVAEEYGADPEEVEEAVQDALMSGRCYEPEDGVLKSI